MVLLIMLLLEMYLRMKSLRRTYAHLNKKKKTSKSIRMSCCANSWTNSRRKSYQTYMLSWSRKSYDLCRLARMLTRSILKSQRITTSLESSLLWSLWCSKETTVASYEGWCRVGWHVICPRQSLHPHQWQEWPPRPQTITISKIGSWHKWTPLCRRTSPPGKRQMLPTFSTSNGSRSQVG